MRILKSNPNGLSLRQLHEPLKAPAYANRQGQTFSELKVKEILDQIADQIPSPDGTMTFYRLKAQVLLD